MKIFSYFTENGLTWFRIFGKGLLWKDTTRNDLLFSERVAKKGWQIWKYRIRLLK